MARPRIREGNLPEAATTFVGRRRELAEVRTKLTTARLVSLVGPGGVGKTRLAIRAGTELERGFADGAWLVELGEVTEAALVTDAVLAALDLRNQGTAKPTEILVAWLRGRRLLLVLDNCEHLLEATADLVNQVLRNAPGVRVITTTREPLQMPGEYVVPVPPLELPSFDEAESLAQLQQNEAIALFTERATAASGAFELTDSNQAAVISLCRRLDGLPLAIELAAVRTRVLSVDQILHRLSDRFALLTGGGRAALPRHQTLETAIDWSYNQLTGTEQVLMRRLCVFAARFSLQDVEAVCAPDASTGTEVLALLASLVDKSLVTRADLRETVCYRLHETMREYAVLKVREAGEEDLLSERCVEHYRAVCRQSAAEARYHLVEWLAWADVEIDNVRAVLHQCVRRRDLARGLEIVASMLYYWVTRGTTEAVRWLDQFMDADDAPASTLARGYYLRGWLCLLQGDATAAVPWTAQAVGAAREAGQKGLLSEALSIAASAACLAGDPDVAKRWLDEAGAITVALDDFPAKIELLLAQSIHAVVQGDLEAFRALSIEGVNLSREAHDLYQLDGMLRNLAMVAMMSGDVDAARSWSVDALQISRQVDNRLTQLFGISAVAWCEANSREVRTAAQLLGAAETLGSQTGAAVRGPAEPLLAEARRLALETLGVATFEAQFRAGQRLSRDAIFRLALGEVSKDDAPRSADSSFSSLAKREVEVAELVADGLSNKQIGARLFISEATVASHIRHIMDKLGVNSRSQIAVLMATHA